MALDNAQWFARVGRVEIGNVTGQRDAQHVVALPKTRDLLVFDRVAHGELGDKTHAGYIPCLAGFVTRCA